MRRAHALLVSSIFVLGSALGLAACGDDDDDVRFDARPGTPDARVFDAAAPDAAAPDAQTARIEDVALSETRKLAGLTADVDVVRDSRGVAHIYGRNDADVLRVQAYLMARDRFPQMEFIRRGVLGRLSEVLGNAAIGMDEGARLAGYGRQGRAIYATLAAGDPTRAAVDAFTAGVNAYVDEILAAGNKAAFIPRGLEIILGLIYNSPRFGRWEPADLLALARFQSGNLSFDTQEINFTRALLGGQGAFGVDPDANPRAGAFADLFSFEQGRKVYTRAGFPTTPLKRAKRRAAARAERAAGPSLALLDAASARLQERARWSELLGGEHGGSNNWVVAKEKTASGHPILANDPHLQLTSPAVWWYVHLNTKRNGGNLDAIGVAFAGLPGVVLGHNGDIAWGATTAGYDVSDVYQETLDGEMVEYKGGKVAIERIDESFLVGGSMREFFVERVPHHGVILSRDGASALSVRYTGDDPSNELAYFLGLLTATNVDEARAAQAAFKVGAQNFVVASRDEISWSSRARVPVRDPRAMTLTISDKGIVSGHCPTFVLPGNGDHEWIDDLDPDLVPHDRNPARGFIATANQDNVGVTDDGNPCNDEHYLGGTSFANGYRQGRIVERLEALAARGNITVDEMIALQAETQSSLGDATRDGLVAALDRAQNLSAFSAGEKATLADFRARLAAWSKKTPHGVGATAAAEIADSVATTIYAAAVTRIIPLAFGDEVVAMVGTDTSRRPPNGRLAALFDRAVSRPQELYTYDGADTVLWDDLNTPEEESRDVIIARGFLAANTFLTGALGADVDGWRWGRLHTVKFTWIAPPTGPDTISIPADSAGFPRHGDYDAVDVGNFSLWNTTSFSHGSGPSFRTVVDVGPAGPRAYIALPGGQTIDPDDEHHADEAQLWIANQQPRLAFTEAEVVANAETRLKFTP